MEPFPSTATGEDRSSQEISIVRLKIVLPKLTILGDQWSDLKNELLIFQNQKIRDTTKFKQVSSVDVMKIRGFLTKFYIFLASVLNPVIGVFFMFCDYDF